MAEHGSITCSDGFEDKSKCELTCDQGQGFVADGAVETDCVNGSWSVEKLKCKEVGKLTIK